MNTTEQYIKVGTEYIDALNKLDKNHPEGVAHILNILNCIHPDPGYHLGIYIEKPSPVEAPTHMCNQAWFTCYTGNSDSIITQPYKNKDGGIYTYGKMSYLRFTFDVFNHLSVEPTAMGAWQAYLLSIAKTLLPFSGGLYYTKRELIFSKEQLSNPITIPRHISFLRGISELKEFRYDVAPSVLIEEEKFVISCCYWNNWGGLFREFANIRFFNGKAYLLDDFNEKNLFKYDCGMRF